MGKQIFSVLLSEVDDLKPAALTSQQGIQIAKPKARHRVSVFKDNRGKVLIFEQRQKLCSVVIHA
ncbi:MAG: hypothetical protein ACJ8CB_27460 [Ktedonobacteraceae bacterium]